MSLSISQKEMVLEPTSACTPNNSQRQKKGWRLGELCIIRLLYYPPTTILPVLYYYLQHCRDNLCKFNLFADPGQAKPEVVWQIADHATACYYI